MKAYGKVISDLPPGSLIKTANSNAYQQLYNSREYIKRIENGNTVQSSLNFRWKLLAR